MSGDERQALEVVFTDMNPVSEMYAPEQCMIVNLYAVERAEDSGRKTVPFVHYASLMGPKGENVRVKSVVDDGAMCGALDSEFYDRVAHRLSTLEPSEKVLRMANGALTPSKGVWKGEMEFGGRKEQGELEVFPSGGAWTVLFGKPLLERFKMSHDYISDEILLKDSGGRDIRVGNQYGQEARAESAFMNWLSTDLLSPAQSPEAESDTTISCAATPRCALPPVKSGDQSEVPTMSAVRKTTVEDVPDEDDRPSPNAISPNEDLAQFPTWAIFPVAFGEPSEQAENPKTPQETPVWVTEEDPGTEQPEVDLDNENLFTRTTDPFKATRVQRVLDLVEIGA